MTVSAMRTLGHTLLVGAIGLLLLDSLAGAQHRYASVSIAEPDTGSRFPFPHNITYLYGIMPSGRNHLHAQESYLAWKNNYVTTSGACGYRRVLFNDMSSIYSGGIGYGMLLAVNFDDRELFDDLWQYYTAHVDSRGLMHWWIGSTCGQILGVSAATDADEDAAFALLLADKQ